MFENSFALVSDPRTLYLTNALKDTIDRVHFTIQKRLGLTCIMGDIGLGKTSVLRMLHYRYEDNKDYLTTLIPTPNFPSEFAMLKQICADFDVPMKRSAFEQMKAFEVWVAEKYQENKIIVVFIDEAQRLKVKELELVRTLLNLETYNHKLIQLVLVGQIELRAKLHESKNKALYSRMFAPSVLCPLTLDETKKMIAYRCHVFETPNPFNDKAIEILYEFSKGVPREVVKLSLEAYRLSLKDSVPITHELVREASKHLEGDHEEAYQVRGHVKANAKTKSRRPEPATTEA